MAKTPRLRFSASSRLSQTVWLSKTVGFWNLRADAELGDIGLVALGQVHLAVEIDGAAVRPGLAGDDVHHRRLAGAVRADDRPQLAGRHDEGERVQRLEPSKDTETLSR